MNTITKYYVKLNRNSVVGYYPTKEKAEKVAATFRRYGFPKAKVILQF